ncbi:helix-turn-helix domain-containing protein [Streptomyces sp. NPDC058240]|uniref:helix-turn-helix domain-containing protein n=1 Tax=Streptomyces sp. NPDC058240 TaxID=3346396 RepID=UPI0036E774FC
MSSGGSASGGFGELLRSLRVRAGHTQERLAHAAGVSVRTLVDLERGRTRGPQRRTVQALARALALDAADRGDLERVAAFGRPRPRLAAAPSGALPLPRDLSDFTARTQALARLRALAEHPGGDSAPVAVVTGQPGLGKTAFAVHAAHTLAPHHPDGQFAIDLCGMDERPADPREVLARLLRALGVTERAIPHDTQDRTGLFRSIAAVRRLLLLMDNAADEDQLRPLLPGRGNSLTVVTSRHALAGLECAHRIDLTLLHREESVELITRIIGAQRVAREAQAARDLADLCGHLPLAVRIAGQRLAIRPQERLGKLVAQLTREESRLDALRAGSLEMRAAFALSYRRLTPIARTLLRRAALAAGPDFSPETAALLAGTTLRRARLCAQDLADRGLLQPHPETERYRFHDLLKLFATEQLAADDDPAALAGARNRTARWMLTRATAAALHFDAEHRRAPDGDPDPVTAPTGPEPARAWLEAERAQWLWALHHAQAAGWHRQVIDTAEAMHWFSDRTQHWEQWAEVFQLAVAAARALGSRVDETVHLNYLAWAYNMCTYDHHAALETADTAFTAARESGDRLQMGWALGYGAGALKRLGRTGEAIAWLRDSAACHRDNTTPQGRLAELTTLNTLGIVLRETGHAGQALAIHLSSEAICRAGIPGQSPDLIAVYHAATLHHLGCDLAVLARWSEAEAPLRQALTAFEAADMPAWSSPARLDLGIALHHLGRHKEARATLITAHRTLTELNHPRHTEAAAHLRRLPDCTG